MSCQHYLVYLALNKIDYLVLCKLYSFKYDKSLVLSFYILIKIYFLKCILLKKFKKLYFIICWGTRILREARENIEPPGAGIANGSEPPAVGAGNLIDHSAKIVSALKNCSISLGLNLILNGIKLKKLNRAVVVHTFNPCTGKTEAGGFL